MTRSAAQIRQDFIDFFRQRGHEFAPSSPVVPHDDPTLLFTNAGMNQFKDVFLATGTRPYKRAANTQKCIRAGGKHNDLDDVGHDTYHHTFFEMLGNWSFGDYFKKEAIAWAWELLTDVWGLDKSRLHATYFEGDEQDGLEPDTEAKELWASVTDIDPTHIHPGSKKDNFWEMGETGPCGPCSEIHIDLTPDKSGAALVNAGDARVIELWNLVFIQFNRDAAGKLTALPARHVDTGLGFERVCALLQGKSSNYDTDVFMPIFQAIQDITGAAPYRGTLPDQNRDRKGAASDQNRDRKGAASDQNRDRKGAANRGQIMIDTSYRVIADHIRCLTFALNDGAVPDREGRGYVLRRILRRAVRYGWQYLNMHEPFLYKLVPAVVDSLGDAFPQLRGSGRRPAGRDEATASPAVGPQRVAEIIRDEEESFDRTLERGIALFEDAADLARTDHHGEIRGEDAFKLHDTYGFPIDLTQIMADEKGLRVDIGEYERLMEEARERARAGGKEQHAVAAAVPPELLRPLGPTDDSPKYATDKLTATVRGIVRFDTDAGPVAVGQAGGIKPGDDAGLIFDQSCFYAEAGGQVGDRGAVTGPSIRFDVEDTQQIGATVVHFGTLVQGAIEVGQRVELEVDPSRPQTMKNHTATHVLNWALRAVLGDHVQQKGSLVDAQKTRFDFSHPRPLSPEELERVENLVNERIQQDLAVYERLVPRERALKINGLRAVFGEKYPDGVRVLSIGTPVEDLLANPRNPEWRKVSIEFCGGTHVRSTGEIERFVFTGEEAVAKGIRRVVAITGLDAQLTEELVGSLIGQAEQLRSGPPEALAEGLAELQRNIAETTITVRQRNKLRDLTAELQRIVKRRQKADAADAAGVVNTRIDELLATAERIGQTTVVVAEMPDVPVDQLKNGADRIKQSCGSAAVLFGVRSANRAVLLAAMSPDLIKKGFKAGDLVKEIAPIVQGGGGGPPSMAQAGGKSPEKISEALEAGREWVRARLT